ncbi:hypothetical protein M441DRAFT_34389 [Trichoderma asperellum CBS 433.97]|uniref:F-box domain-containing protein n=1 Tax=Trichoderma asperellum (strain ATCC 204424 / CBS 433.97 / NBRC 101777) TaxID=1042311 RepID=A0A2T3ZLX3_TRIA4|nr:hypothetical protein M441DRAFT_34389 [Trichoderma asperellum CBS 433.97]PTB45809.1 hypothetical protein M441DRAFT_34389 [Trichoderma asperellum CBS 433.97]
MTQEPIKTPKQLLSNSNLDSLHLSQHGSLPRDASGLRRDLSGGLSHSRLGPDDQRQPLPDESGAGVNADQLDKKLQRLTLGEALHDRPSVPGQRISEYEKALASQTAKQDVGFQVVKRSEPRSDGIRLDNFPNEILTHIFSHLPPDCHSSVALVSKRFWALVTTHHAWRMAFMRYFPGHTILDNHAKADATNSGTATAPSSDILRFETRYFPRLTSLATWRSEYLLRTRHLRSLARGKPGTPAGGTLSGRVGRAGKKNSAVLTYNSKLPWQVTNIHAVFLNGKKPPRVVQGAGDLGAASVSDPTTGKIEKWGLEDLFSMPQLDEVAPNLLPYGLGDGPAGVPNTMDVSYTYGVVAGEGFPGGRPFFRGINVPRGRYIGAEISAVDAHPDIPKIPEMSDAICSVWIAKSSAVTSTTQSMCGILTGSALGVVTAYSLGWDTTGPRYANGDVTARWIISPGVPIISLKVDDSFNQKRKSTSRVWAVALNALGEVYYLCDVPVGKPVRASGEDMTRNAWYTGRTVYWHLLDATRRVAREDELDKNATRGAYSPRSPSNGMHLSKEQLVAEAREIEKFMRYRPSHFRKVCDGWDMQRKLEVDFASDDGKGAGENIFVIDCGTAENRHASIQRYSRSLIPAQKPPSESTTPVAPISTSLFGSIGGFDHRISPVSESQTPLSPPPTPKSPPVPSTVIHDWSEQALELKGYSHDIITSVALDNSLPSLFTLGEDPLHTANEASSTTSPWADHGSREIPGRRTRFIVIGTNSGAVLVWNARDDDKTRGIQPLRILQTESPEVSAVAASGLYLVHGGSDGLVQAWDPLASIVEPIRTINARSNSRVPRQMLVMNPALRENTYSAVGAIFLDPDPTTLQGVVSFGAFLRYWSYGSQGHAAGRKRRVRHADMDNRLASRRQGAAVTDYIASEEAEMHREDEQQAREYSRRLKRFGALGDLTEEEAILYAQMVSEEAYHAEEQRRASDSAADASLDTASSFSENTVETVTPDPSIVEPSASEANGVAESEYEQQIQQAIRLSLMESVGNEGGQSPIETSRGNSSGDFDLPVNVKYKPESSKKGKQSESGSPSSSHTPVGGPLWQTTSEDEDLAIALSLSMQDQGGYSPPPSSDPDVGLGAQHEEFPSLPGDGFGKGKGKTVQRW